MSYSFSQFGNPFTSVEFSGITYYNNRLYAVGNKVLNSVSYGYLAVVDQLGNIIIDFINGPATIYEGISSVNNNIAYI